MPQSPEVRPCLYCGALMPGASKARFYCQGTKCKVNASNLTLGRGHSLVPLLLVWRGGKHGKNRELASWAFREACSLLDRYNAEDRAAGRSVVPLIERKMEFGWRAADLLDQKAGPE